MSCLHYNNNELFIENVSLKKMATQFGTPTYIYSRTAVETNFRAFTSAFNTMRYRICYAVKANSNIAILNLLAKLNAGFDIVSIGELERVIRAGGDPKKIVFSGVAKTASEIEQAINIGIHCFNVESASELERLQSIATQLNTVINVAVRINPNVDPRTHSHISTGLSDNKFGIEISDIIPLCRQIAAMPALRLIGIASHIGSQITEIEPFLLNVEQLLTIYHALREMNITIQHIDIGGGLGITYRDECPPSIVDYANALQEKLKALPVEIILEPGRAIVGNAGVLLTRIEYLKHNSQKNFAIVDAGMNDLLRPALYDAWQEILPVELRHTITKHYDIAGPVCESADFLGKNRELAILPGDLLAVDSAGAYGFSMSSNYNSRCRPAEILVDGSSVHLIRRRETIQELLAAESLPQ